LGPKQSLTATSLSNLADLDCGFVYRVFVFRSSSTLLGFAEASVLLIVMTFLALGLFLFVAGGRLLSLYCRDAVHL